MTRSPIALFAVLFSPILIGIGSCSKGPAWKEESFVKREVSLTPAEVALPAEMLNKIRNLSATSTGKKESDGGHAGGNAKEKTLPTQFESIKVYLIERNRGILGGKNHEIEFAAGGGEIDLRDFVQPLNGSFFVAAEFMPDVAAGERRVFYLSNSLLRRKQSETVGAGCNAYFDISGAFEKAMSGSGFLVNTSEQRHVSALAGTYVFSSVQAGKLHLASLIIRDSGQRALLCRR